MNKKHMAFLLIFGFAVLSVLLLLVSKKDLEMALCLVYNCTAAITSLAWGGVIKAKKFNNQTVSGVMFCLFLLFAALQSVVHMVN